MTPQNIIQNIKNIAQHIRIGRQEDAHEFLLYFLAAMETSATNYLISIEKKYNKIKKNQLTFMEDNLIQKIFGGTLNSSVTCKKCKSVSSRTDRFLDISLVSILNYRRCLITKVLPSVLTTSANRKNFLEKISTTVKLAKCGIFQ